MFIVRFIGDFLLSTWILIDMIQCAKPGYGHALIVTSNVINRSFKITRIVDFVKYSYL